jgi:hypothetical protein
MKKVINKVFTIPVDNTSRGNAKETIGQIISDYNEDINFDDEMGTVEINGNKIPYNRTIWLPSPSDDNLPYTNYINTSTYIKESFLSRVYKSFRKLFT